MSTGLRKPRAADQRRPRFWLTWKAHEPSLSPVLKSAIGLMPACSAASRKASSMIPAHARMLDAPFAAGRVMLARRRGNDPRAA